LATGIKKISAQASSGGGDFGGLGCYLSSCNLFFLSSFKTEDFTPKSIKSGKIVRKVFIFKKSIFLLNDLE
jgi:hypothetical protein